MKRAMELAFAAVLAASTGAVAQPSAFVSGGPGPGGSLPGLNAAMFAGAGAQVKDDLFAGTEKFAQGASEVSEINLDPKTMGMLGKKGEDSEARKMKFVVIHSYTYEKPGMYRMEDVEVYRKKLEDGSWSCAVHVRDKDGTTDICSRESAKHEGREMVILTAEPKELTFIHLSGDMSLNDLSKMGGSMGGLKKR